jgi:GYF domain 2
MSDPIKYYVMVDEKQQGPYILAQLRAMWRAGSLTAETQYWFEGQTEWMPLETILELLEPPSSPAPRYIASPPAYSPPAKAKRGIGTSLRLGCGVLLVLFLAVFIIGLVLHETGNPPSQKSQNYRNLTYGDSYFDVIRALGQPDKEIEERDVPLPNVVLGYAEEKWIVYVMYSDRSFDKSTSHYLGIIDTQGSVVHAADEKSQTVLEALAYGIKHDVK